MNDNDLPMAINIIIKYTNTYNINAIIARIICYKSGHSLFKY